MADQPPPQIDIDGRTDDGQPTSLLLADVRSHAEGHLDDGQGAVHGGLSIGSPSGGEDGNFAATNAAAHASRDPHPKRDGADGPPVAASARTALVDAAGASAASSSPLLGASSSAASSQSNPSSSRHHSHTRSRSVNLSPTLQAGPSFSPGAIKWDPYANDVKRTLNMAASSASSPSLGHLHASTGAAGASLSSTSASSSSPAIASSSTLSSSPHLRPMSPIYVNVHGLTAPSATPVDIATRSPLYAGSEGSSSSSSSNGDAGTSPEARRPSHLIARVMERSTSGGSLNNNLTPRSPRSPRGDSMSRRTASPTPSRAYAVPISPRLQALGAAPSHARRASGGNGGARDPIARSTSPLLRSTSPRAGSTASTGTANASAGLAGSPGGSVGRKYDEDLPVDSVWPQQEEQSASHAAANGADVIPVATDVALSTPIPPSLRDEVAAQSNNGIGISALSMPGPSSPIVRSKSPLIDWSSAHVPPRLQRTPSPSNWQAGTGAGKGRRMSNSNPSSSPSMSASVPLSSSPLHSSSLGLAAPQPIAENALNLTSIAMRRHSRGFSNSSNESDSNDQHAREGGALARGASPANAHVPTFKAISLPRAPHAELDDSNAHAHLSASSSSGSPHTTSSRLAQGGSEDKASWASSLNAGGDAAGRPLSENEERTVMLARSNSSSPQQRFRLLERKPSFELSSPLQSPRNIFPPTSRDFAQEVIGGRSQSPAFRAASPASSGYSESPPKVRSFIGMPPRSGYELSDDPDDVGSEDGSVGSGRDSVGTNEDREDDDEDDEGDTREEPTFDLEQGDDDAMEIEDRGNESVADGQYDSSSKSGRGIDGRPALPKRPSLTSGSVVAPQPYSPSTAVGQYWGDDADSKEDGFDPESQVANQGETATGPNEDEVEGQEGQEGQEEEEEEDALQEESLTTLERIFLFAKSEMTYHRILVSHSLSDWILEVELTEAVEFVIPLLNGLACDVNEVCIAFAPQLHRVMWYFFRNCPLTGDEAKENGHEMLTDKGEEDDDSVERAPRPRLSVAIFTPLLCALLLNTNATIANATQASIVFFFARLQGHALEGDTFEADENEVNAQQPDVNEAKLQHRQPFDQNTALVKDAAAREDKRVPLENYDFTETDRQMVMQELLEHVALAIGHLSVQPQTSMDESEAFENAPAENQTEMEVQEIPSQESTENDTSVAKPETDARGEEMEHSSQTREEDISEPTKDHDETSTDQSDDLKHHIEHQTQTADLSLRTQAQSEEDPQDDPQSLQDDQNDPESDLSMAVEETQEGENGQSWSQTDGPDDIGDSAMMSMECASVTMSIEEEVAVGRMASISLLAALGSEELISSDFLLEKAVPELISSSADQTFFVRKEVAVAIGLLARSIGSTHIEKHDILSVFERLCQDNIWHVRQAACLSVPSLFTQLTDRTVRRVRLLQILGAFVADDSRNVRVAALDIIGEVIYLFHNDPEGVPAELVRHFLGKSWNEEDEQGNDGRTQTVNERVLVDQEQGGSQDIAESQNALESDTLPSWPGESIEWSSSSYNSEALENIHNPLQSGFFADPDRPLVMAYNLPAVALTLGASQWPVLRSVHAQLCNHVSSKVRRSLAASLHEIAKIIGTDAASEDLVQFVAHFLDSKYEQDGDVKTALLENIDVFLAHIRLDKALEVLDVLHDLWNDDEPFGMGARFPNHWRMRHKLVSKLPILANRLLLDDDRGVLVMLMQSALLDSVSAVRNEGVKTVRSLYQLFAEHDQVLADGFLGMLVDLYETRAGYRARVATLHALEDLCKGQIQRASIEMLVMPRLVEWSRDEIVDVRLALASLIALVCHMDQLYALPQSRSSALSGIIRRLAYDDAPLVRLIIANAFSEDAITELGPPSPMVEARPRRELVLGPHDGGPHRPPPMLDEIHEATMEDPRPDDDTTLFEMDDEERQAGAANEFATDDNVSDENKRPAPSLANSTLARRRMLNNHHSTGISNGIDTMHERDGDPDSTSAASIASQFEDGVSDEDMIVIPEDENALLLSARSPEQRYVSNEAINEDDDDDAPHHLLGIADPMKKSPMPEQKLKIAPFDAFAGSSDAMLMLESPERPFRLQNSGDTQSEEVALDGSGRRTAMTNGAKSEGGVGGVRDPFLAFVADQYNHSKTMDGDSEKAVQHHDVIHEPASAHVKPPFSPPQQRSTFEDDDEDEEQSRFAADDSAIVE